MSTIETLITQLQDEDSPVRVSAAETLAGMAEEAQPAIVTLVQNCGSEDEGLCNWCTAALEAVGEPAEDQIDELALLVGSADSNVAFWAATLLGRAGSIASSATTILKQRSDDTSAPEVQRRAVWALERIQAA